MIVSEYGLLPFGLLKECCLQLSIINNRVQIPEYQDIIKYHYHHHHLFREKGHKSHTAGHICDENKVVTNKRQPDQHKNKLHDL